MCGIIAASTERSIGKLLIQGLYKMEYRGYDSAGIAMHTEDRVAHLRALGKVKLLEDLMINEKPKEKLALHTHVGQLTVNPLRSMLIRISQMKEFL